MFDLEAFKQYLLLNADSAKANKIALAELINAIADFTQTPDKYLGIPSNSSSYYIKKVFYTLLVDKPKSVGVQKYLLNTYGYQKCFRCSSILTLCSYNKKSDRWNLLDNECRDCSNYRYKVYRANNLEKELCRDNKYKNANKEIIAEKRVKRYKKNPKEEIKKVRAWQLLNSDKVTATSAKRRAYKVFATPLWLTSEQFTAISLFYTKAKTLEQETGIKCHVDHIIPLQGKYVCGLHVPWNLQVLSREENISKRNYHESEEYWK
jgi:hypothetical protein